MVIICFAGTQTLVLVYCRSAVACLGGIYEKMGRMTGRSYEETVQALIKSLKSAEVCMVEKVHY